MESWSSPASQAKALAGTDITVEKAALWAFRQVLQWQCPMGCGAQSAAYLTAPQRQLPSIIFSSPAAQRLSITETPWLHMLSLFHDSLNLVLDIFRTSTMPDITANGISIAYEDHGDPAAPPVLMVMGLGGQLAMWPDELVQNLVGSGYRVILFDNRDIGLSHQHTDERPPKIIPQILLRRLGVKLKTPYTLLDMARDTIGLIDALGLQSVHLVGISMGGMIGQHVCALAPEKVQSLTAIMTTTGNPKLPRAEPHVMKAMIRRGPPPKTRDAIIDASVGVFGVIGTPGEDHNTNGMRERIARSYDRNYDPKAVARQMAAIVAAGDFRSFTRRVSAPTLVLHGSSDPLVPIEAGRDVAGIVPDARMEVLDGMGHDVPPRFLPEVTNHMLSHFSANS